MNGIGRIVATVCLLAASAAWADSARERVAKGNRAFAAGDYRAALDAWDEASVDAPESPHIEFNRGTVFYRLDEFPRAKEAFEKAALNSRDVKFEAKCHYNLGNCAFREGQRQRESDLRKALAGYEEAVRHYREALDRDPALEDAARNIEITRLTIKQILDEIKRQEEEREKEREERERLERKLEELIERQRKALDEGRRLQVEERRTGMTEALEKRTAELAAEQGRLENETRDLAGEMEKAQAGPQVEEARRSLERAVSEQRDAATLLDRRKPAEAEPPQERALEALEEAAKALQQPRQPEDGQQQQQEPQEEPQQEESASPEPEPQPKTDETPRDILEEEKRNRERRQLPRPGGYRPVDKDW